MLPRARRLAFRFLTETPRASLHPVLARLVCEEMVAVMEPQEIEDGEYEQILERVAAVDVAKASGMVCTRVPREDQPGKRRTRVWQVDAATSAILELADHLVGEGIEKVTLESTSDYWRIWFYLLESAGLSVQLVRAQDVKQAPGRPKSDLLTELPTGSCGGCGRRPGRLARFARCDQRRGRAQGLVAAGGAAAGLAGGDRGSIRPVSAG